MMDDKTIVTGVLLDENTTISIVEVCRSCRISEDELLEMIEHGLFELKIGHPKDMGVDHNVFRRIQSARRMQHDLGINLPGVVLVLELLDELERVHNELNILQHHVDEDSV